MRTIVIAISLLNLAAPSLLAQETPAASATLTGHVICADTNGPARFATVTLKQVIPPKTFEQIMQDLEAEKQRTAAQTGQPATPPSGDEFVAIRAVLMQKARREVERTEMNEPAMVGADGTYLFPSVPPGTYYIHATMPGYADSFALFSAEDFASTDPAIRALIAQSAPTVTISDTGSARMDLSIERGASISGRILYDDGAPAQNWSVIARKSPKPGAPMSNAGRGAVTDDLGHFRVAGLPAGEYVLGASYQGSMFHGNSTATLRPDHFAIVIWSGNTSFASKAQPIGITAGEERIGVDITVPLHNLHRVSGQVLAKTDSRPANNGSVSLSTVDESAFAGSSVILPDGSFTIDFVPGNTAYTLKVDRPAEIKSTPRPDGTPSQSTHEFGSISTQITLHDSDVVNIILSVPESSAAPER